MERANHRVIYHFLVLVNKGFKKWISDQPRRDAKKPDVNTVDPATREFLESMEEFSRIEQGTGKPKWYAAWIAGGVALSERIIDRSTNKALQGLGLPVAEGLSAKATLEAGREKALSRVITLMDQEVARLGQVMADSYGLSRVEIQKRITREFQNVLGAENARPGMPTFRLNAERHANLLARDQVLSTNSEVARFKMASAGINRYVWTTSQDERVRERHADVDGQIFSVDVGAPGVLADGGNGNPGDDYQCRCVMFPVTGLDDD